MKKSSEHKEIQKHLSGSLPTSCSIDKQSTDSCWFLRDLEETIQLGKNIAKTIPDLKLLLLEGPLGAGKTSFVKGVAIALGISEPITSPTFPLAQHYPTGSPPLIHIDLYRLENHNVANELFLQEEEEADALGALMVVEWPERLNIHLPEAWRIQLKHHKSGGRLAQLSPPSISDKNSLTSI